MSESASPDESQRQATDRPILGADDNWWYDETEHPQPHEESMGHADHGGTSRAEWIAHHLVKESAPAILSAMALFGDPDDPLATHDAQVEVELTEPREYVAPSTLEAEGEPERELYGDHRRVRVDEEHGYLGGVVLADRSTHEFMALVELVVAMAEQNEGLQASTADDLVDLARSRKEASCDATEDQSDVAIVAELITCIEDPSRLDEAEW